jgi:hypothetical protein
MHFNLGTTWRWVVSFTRLKSQQGPIDKSVWVAEQIGTQQGETKCLLPRHETPSHYTDLY